MVATIYWPYHFFHIDLAQLFHITRLNIGWSQLLSAVASSCFSGSLVCSGGFPHFSSSLRVGRSVLYSRPLIGYSLISSVCWLVILSSRSVDRLFSLLVCPLNGLFSLLVRRLFVLSLLVHWSVILSSHLLIGCFIVPCASRDVYETSFKGSYGPKG